MVIPSISSVLMFVPVTGPRGVDLTVFPVDLALMPDDSTEPGPADWHAAAWLAPQAGDPKEAALQVGSLGVVYPDGDYMAWWRLTTGTEQPADKAGRVRIGTP